MFIRKLAVLASLATIGFLSLGSGSDSSTLVFQGLGSFHCAQSSFEATLNSNTGFRASLVH
jgi:hypothetical protein